LTALSIPLLPIPEIRTYLVELGTQPVDCFTFAAQIADDEVEDLNRKD